MKDIYTQEQIDELAEAIGNGTKEGGLICLFGDLGTGKTTFTKALAKNYGVEEMVVKSPTYTYIREYNGEKNKIFHIDLYRIEELDDLLMREICELMDNKNNIVIIEWADKIKMHLPKGRTDISFEYIDEFSRKITISNE